MFLDEEFDAQHSILSKNTKLSMHRYISCPGIFTQMMTKVTSFGEKVTRDLVEGNSVLTILDFENFYYVHRLIFYM